MVSVAKRLRRQIVDLKIAGSSPVAHPSSVKSFQADNNVKVSLYFSLLGEMSGNPVPICFRKGDEQWQSMRHREERWISYQPRWLLGIM